MNAGSLFVSLLVSGLGFVLFQYGRKQTREPQIVTGLVLMVYPYFVSGVAWMLAIATALMGLLWLALRAGY